MLSLRATEGSAEIQPQIRDCFNAALHAMTVMQQHGPIKKHFAKNTPL
jgi:hypothetical protein